MSKASVWGDSKRVSDLKTNLVQDKLDTEAINGNDYKHGSPKIGDTPSKLGLQHVPNSPSFLFTRPNVRNNSRFRKWIIDYRAELEEIYKLFLNGLKNMNFLPINKLEIQFPSENFYQFVYKNTSFK